MEQIFERGVAVFSILIGAYIAHKFGHRLIERVIRKSVVSGETMDKEAEIKRENTLIRIIAGTVSILVWITAGMMLLSEMGLNIGPLLAAAGVAGLAVGFGGQYLIKDLVSGLFIIMENQYRVGDVVCFGDSCGLVEDISLRMTTLRDLNGTVHHVPHGEVKKVSNLTKTWSRVDINLRVDYAADLEKVIKLVNEIGHELAEDPKWKADIIKPPQFYRVDDFAESAVVIKILGDTKPIRQWDVMGELRRRIKIAFDKEGIRIPIPQRMVHLKNETK